MTFMGGRLAVGRSTVYMEEKWLWYTLKENRFRLSSALGPLSPYPAVSVEPGAKWPERVSLFTLHRRQVSSQDTEVRRVLPFSSEATPREDLVNFPAILPVILS
jgi:hypothetical protein